MTWGWFLVLFFSLIIYEANFLHFWKNYIIEDNYPENINIISFILISFILGLTIAIFSVMNLSAN